MKNGWPLEVMHHVGMIVQASLGDAATLPVCKVAV